MSNILANRCSWRRSRCPAELARQSRRNSRVTENHALKVYGLDLLKFQHGLFQAVFGEHIAYHSPICTLDRFTDDGNISTLWAASGNAKFFSRAKEISDRLERS